MTDGHTLEEVIGQFTAEIRRGDEPSIQDYVARYPELAGDIRRDFPLLLRLEELGSEPLPVPERLGEYRIVRELGRGGMGVVYEADHEGKCVAVKVIHPHLLDTGTSVQRYLREARLGMKLRHVNIVHTLGHDVCEVDGRRFLYLVMEYVEGQTLSDLLLEIGRAPEKLCIDLGREIAKALVAIHDADAVHRDLKPANVLVTRENKVKVMDFGVARFLGSTDSLSKTGAFIGSLRYAAPEQLLGEKAGPAADLYAVGLMLYELATGGHPTPQEDFAELHMERLANDPQRISTVNPQLSPFFEEVVHTLLARAPEDRFESARMLLEVLEQGERSPWWPARARAIRLESKRPPRRIHIPRETALHGRDAELQVLGALYGEAREGRGQVVLIEGEAGVGKTRLVDEFVRGLERDGEDLNFLFGSYPPGGAATATGAFTTAYREQFGVEALAETLADYLKQTPILVPAFAALLKSEPPPEGHEPLTKESLETVFVHATRSLAAERPTVILIDDLHFAPEGGHALFAALTYALPGHRVLLIGSTRPDLPEKWTRQMVAFDHASHMVLSRLGPKVLSTMLIDVLGSRTLAAELALEIAVKSDGNPFFVFEIVRSLQEGAFIRLGEGGKWERGRDIAEIQIPTSVVNLIEARLDDLNEEEREILQVAACCGFQFDPALVATALGSERIPLLRALGRIERSNRLLHAAGQNYLFDHHLVQETLYGSLSEPLRQEYHVQLAEAMTARLDAAQKDPAELPGAVALDLCGHLLSGDRVDQALRYLDAALDHLQRNYRHEAAVKLADRALVPGEHLDVPARVTLLLRKVVCLDFLGWLEEEGTDLAEAVALADECGDTRLQAQARHGLALHALHTNDLAKAERHARRGLEIARSREDVKLEAEMVRLVGEVSLGFDRYTDAQRHLEEALRLFRVAGDRQGEAEATGNLGKLAINSDRLDKAREYHGRALALAQDIGLRRLEVLSIRNLGSTAWGLCRYRSSLEHLERALPLAREIGDRRTESRICHGLFSALERLGRYGDAWPFIERGLALSRETGGGYLEGWSRMWRGVFLANHGLGKEALGELERAREIFEHHAGPRTQAWADGYLARARQILGDHDQALRDLERGLASCRRIGFRAGEARVLFRLGEAAEQADDRARAAACFDQVGALVQGATGVSWEHHSNAQSDYPAGAEPLLVSGLLAMAHRAALSGEHVDAARRAMEMCGGLLGHTQCMEAHFALFRATGEREHIATAHRMLCELRDRSPHEFRRSMIRDVPLHRTILTAWARFRRGW